MVNLNGENGGYCPFLICCEIQLHTVKCVYYVKYSILNIIMQTEV